MILSGKNFNARVESLNKKKLEYYKIESIENLFQIVLVINPKEYFEQFEDQKSYNKYKGVKKVLLAWNLKISLGKYIF